MIVERATTIEASAEEVFAWHARPGGLERLVPPWEEVRLVTPHPGLIEGSRVELEIASGFRWITWLARQVEVEPGRGFVDLAERSPFARWRHRHRFEPIDSRRATVSDRIECELRFGPLGELGEPWVRRRIQRTLRYRHQTLAGDLALHARFQASPRLTVAITGASGLIGRTLVPMLTTGGHRVIRLVRRPAGQDEIQWDPASGLDPQSLSTVDAVIHLAGESIAGRRWSPEQKARIKASRLEGTRAIVDAMVGASPRPRTLISASAIGIYGDRGEEELTEDSPPGTGFLAEVGTGWERATDPARAAGIRTVPTRFGIVLSPAGGALAQMLPLFRLGLGGPMGNGRQWMSWIGIDDLAGGLIHTLVTESLEGPVNLVAPEPVRNRDFATTLGRALGRPAVLPAPAPALRLVVGELADEALLASARVRPDRLRQTDYRFRHPELGAALSHLLGRDDRR